jgi:cation transport ATPase
MIHTYHITGMTCGSCVAKVKSELLKTADVEDAAVQLAAPQATITMQKHISLQRLQVAVSRAGAYTITEESAGVNTPMEAETPWLTTYKPVLLIGAYITVTSVLLEAAGGSFVAERWMGHFMAGFFLTFSFFKFLDLKGFADAYATYDIIAKRWKGWGYLYAFIEFALGIAYLLQLYPVVTSAVTFVVMSLSIVGVLQSIWKGKRIRCACLGAVFNLPMSTITVIEDGLMIAMSAVMMLVL